MRIAMISEHASPLACLGGVDAGGQNVHVAALAEHLAAAGHHVDVYTRRDDPDLPERVRMRGFDVVHVPAGPPRPVPKDDLLPWMPAMGTWLADRWRQERPDVVHAHFWMSGLAALQAVRALPGHVPVVQTFHALGSVKRRHQGDRDTSPRGRIETEAGLGRRVDLVVATCRDEVAELARLGVPPARVTVVPCGVDVEHFRPGALPDDGRFRVLSLGRLVERKGVDTVVRALVDVPGAELTVAGGPPLGRLWTDPEAVRLRDLARRLGVAERVRFVGSVTQPEVPDLVRRADVVVATPWYEPFGIVPLEAAACGRPLVGSAVGGLLDSVDDGVTGLLVPPRDPAALAGALRTLETDPARRRRMGAAARRRAVARFAWDRVAAATHEAYRTVVGAQAVPSAQLARVEAV